MDKLRRLDFISWVSKKMGNSFFLKGFHSVAMEELYCRPEELLVVDGWFQYDPQRLAFTNHNWGDDLNFPLLKRLTHRRVIPRRFSLFHQTGPYLSAIGSVLQFSSGPQAVIWGSGFHHNVKDVQAPKKIFAVRGPWTKRIFDQHGIECPDVFGDPALILPQLYSPEVSVKYKIGLIPHFRDISKIENYPIVKNKECLVINLAQYNDIWSVVRQMKSCETIISSSLHGLIAADAYGIPSKRLCIPSKEPELKFADYYLSYLPDLPSYFREKALEMPVDLLVKMIHQDYEGRAPMEKVRAMARRLLELLPEALACLSETGE